MRKIQYDNFNTAVEQREVDVIDPQTGTPAKLEMKLLVIMDQDGATIHEFAYPLEHAKRLGEELGADPKPRVVRGTPADLAKLGAQAREGAGRIVGA